MKFVGYAIILWSVVSLLVNIPRYVAVRRRIGSIREDVPAFEAKVGEAAFLPQIEYHGGLIVFSIGAMPIGAYIAVNNVTGWQLLGFALVLSSLGGLVQSFRKSETQALLAQRGDYETSVTQMAWRLRAIAVAALAFGAYLIAA